jgi:hypothetical protein
VVSNDITSVDFAAGTGDKDETHLVKGKTDHLSARAGVAGNVKIDLSIVEGAFVFQ